MGRLTARFLSLTQHWEAPARRGFLLALVLIVPALVAAALGPRDLRTPATISVMGLVIVAQLIFMWANRGMVTPYSKAQRYYLAGDFDTARSLLEDLRQSGDAGMRELTLLGNTYRQLGLLYDSLRVLSEALDIQPEHHFPLYGFGRTLMVMGRYDEAIEVLQRALQNGAPSVVRYDLGELLYRADRQAVAQEVLLDALPTTKEPHRRLMALHLLQMLGHGNGPTDALLRQGLPYWQAQAALYAETPYGVVVQEDVAHIQSRQKETGP